MKKQSDFLYVRIEKGMKDQLKEKADKSGLSLSAYVKMELKKLLN
jgi:predicted HicB family RNase H-like nuclease